MRLQFIGYWLEVREEGRKRRNKQEDGYKMIKGVFFVSLNRMVIVSNDC